MLALTLPGESVTLESSWQPDSLWAWPMPVVTADGDLPERGVGVKKHVDLGLPELGWKNSGLNLEL